MDLNKYSDLAGNFIVNYGTRIIGAALIFFIGLYLVKALSKGFGNFMDKRKLDPSLKPFLVSLVSTLLRVLLFIIVLSKLGVEMTSFVAMMAAAGLAIGMALSGTLQNFAGGVIILIFRPFKVGDLIEAQTYLGVVSEIHIFTTVLLSLDNKTIIMPNGALSNNSLTNYTRQPLRRVDITIGIAYGNEVELAKKILFDIFSKNDKILNEPQPPFVEIVKLNASSVDIQLRVWCKSEDYWDVYFKTNLEIYNQFNQESGIHIPYPQMDVHLHNKN